MPVCFLLSSMLFVYVLLIMMPILKCCLALSIGRCATVWLWMVFKWQQYRRLVRKRNEELWVETEETASRESRITPRPERNPQRTLSATYPHSLRGTSTTVCLPLACIRPVNLPCQTFYAQNFVTLREIRCEWQHWLSSWESFKMKFD